MLRGGLTRRVVLASGLLVLIVASAFVLLVVAVDGMRDSARQARHSRAELASSDRLEKLVIDVETGQRGFVITRRERFLGPWTAARRAIPAEASRLESLTDDPAQERLGRELVQAIDAYIRDYSVPLVNAARRGEPSARTVAATAAGKQRVDAIRGSFDRVGATETVLAAKRERDADAAARRAIVVATGGLVGSILLIVLFTGYLTRTIVLPVRRAAAMASRLAGGDLTVRMPETAAAEVGALERAFNTMGTSLETSDAQLRRIAEEQAALGRVATLVARGVSPRRVFDAVAGEVGELLDADATGVLRYESDGTATLVGGWRRDGAESPFGQRLTLEGDNVTAKVRSTGRSARMGTYESAPGSLATHARGSGYRSSVGAPIVVEGRLWGVMVAASEQEQAPADVEGRMTEFTELVATAIANANSRAELSASRARVVAAADEARRRIERDLHDGTQQRLVALGLELRAAEAIAPADLPELRARLDATAKGLAGAVEDLQEISRGIHPAVLSRGGLGPALKTLASRSAVPVQLEVADVRRLPQPIEAAAYYVVSEGLANAAKHAGASAVRVHVDTDDAVVRLSIRDDGVGGAEFGQGSGLMGLKDRVEALGGAIAITSPAGGGTSLRVEIPIERS